MECKESIITWFRSLSLKQKVFSKKKKKLEFTTCKAEQPLQSMELQEKKHKKDYTGHRKSV